MADDLAAANLLERGSIDPKRTVVNLPFSFRLRWTLGHLAVSVAVVTTVVLAVFVVWYPPPLASLQGLGSILLLLAFVDLCLGPLCTLLVASPKKGRAHVARDVALIGLIQFIALAYGVHSVWVARPAYVVFNKDRFDVVGASELEFNYFGRLTKNEYGAPPLGRAKWVHALPPSSLEERNNILIGAAIGGPDLRHFPELYHPWPQDAANVRGRLKPIEDLAAQGPRHAAEVSEALRRAGLQASQVAYLPLVGRSRVGVVLVKRDDLTIISSLDVVPSY